MYSRLHRTPPRRKSGTDRHETETARFSVSFRLLLAVTIFLPTGLIVKAQLRTSKIDQSMSIVAETEGILNRRNFPLKSRAKISDGSVRRFFVVRSKNLRR